MTKIISLASENVKRLRAVHITPGGPVVSIEGKNGNGKTSVLDSILYALGGKSVLCEQPVRRGEKKAKVVVELDNGLTVTRTFTADGGGTLKVSSDKANFSSPQAVLDKLVGDLTLDPLAFVRLRPLEQIKILRGVAGLDFAELDAERKQLFDERTIVRRDAAAKSAVAAARPKRIAPDEPVDAKALSAELDAELAKRAASERAASERAANEAGLKANREALSAANQELRSLGERSEREEARANEAYFDEVKAAAKRRDDRIAQARLLKEQDEKNLSEKIVRLGDAAAACEKAFASIPDAFPANDVDSIKARLAEASETNANVEYNRQTKAIVAEATALEDRVAALTSDIDLIDERKQKLLADAKFPVPGLSFGDTGVFLNGLPFSQASSAEQLRASVAIGLALNPKLSVLLIRDGSLLDAESRADLEKIAEENSAQVWLEICTDGDARDGGILIVDGSVAGAGEVVAEPQG